MVALVAVKFVNAADKALNTAAKKFVVVAFVIDAFTPLIVFPAKFPVDVKFDAVVDARVDEPDTVRLVNKPVAKARIFPRIFVTVVEASVDDPVALIFVEFITVEVLFVIVPLVALIFVRVKFPAESVVMVALVIVEFVTFSPTMLAVEIFEVEALLVVANVVLAYTEVNCVVPVAFKFVALTIPEFVVAMFPVVAVKVVNTAVIAFKMFVAKLPVTVKLEAVVLAIVDDPLTFKLVK
jgi:hypothetical protein